MIESSKALEPFRETPQMTVQYSKIVDSYNNFVGVELQAKRAADALGYHAPGHLAGLIRRIDRYIDRGEPMIEIVESEHDKHKFIAPVV